MSNFTIYVDYETYIMREKFINKELILNKHDYDDVLYDTICFLERSASKEEWIHDAILDNSERLWDGMVFHILVFHVLDAKPLFLD